VATLTLTESIEEMVGLLACRFSGCEAAFGSWATLHAMPQISDKAKTIAKMLAVVPAFFFFSLIPWLIVANLLGYFRLSEDYGRTVLARFLEVTGIVLAIATAAWTVFGLIFWLVQLVRVIFDLGSRDENHVA
jgi:hypothetical protein